jgi:membrane-associated phospholipid phosphatase
LSSALAIACEGIVGDWDGSAQPDSPQAPANPNRPGCAGIEAGLANDIARLQADQRVILVSGEARSLFALEKHDNGAISLFDKGTLAAGDSNALIRLTPPTADHVATNQLQFLRSSMDLRGDRMPEILVQQGDMMSFFGALLRIDPNRHWWTSLLMAAMYNAVVGPEVAFKFHSNLIRPMELAPEVSAVIQTPGHSAYPSGHATEAFAFATILAALWYAGRGYDDPVAQMQAELALDTDGNDRLQRTPALLFRMAHRIAQNRTVAGVHYPVDSAHGAMLGHAMGLALVSYCTGGNQQLMGWSLNGNDWSEDFTGTDFTRKLVNANHTAAITVPVLEDGSVLRATWCKAISEW